MPTPRLCLLDQTDLLTNPVTVIVLDIGFYSFQAFGCFPTYMYPIVETMDSGER